jgi:hypothetical protein
VQFRYLRQVAGGVTKIQEGSSFNYTISLSARPSLTVWAAIEVKSLTGSKGGLLVEQYS